MDGVCSLSLRTGVRLLQTAVRETQGSKRASYAVKDRPEWWNEKHQVELPDGTSAVTGRFISHSKSAWTLPQVKAALVLYYRHLNGDEEPSSATHQQSRHESVPPRSQAPKTEESVSSNPSRVTRSQKKEEALIEDSHGQIPSTHATATEDASPRATRARLKKPVNRTRPIPRHARGKSKARRIVISDSEAESSALASPIKRHQSSSHTQHSVQSFETQKRNKCTNPGRINRRPRAKGENEEIEAQPEEEQGRSERRSAQMVKAPAAKTCSPKKRNENRKPSKTIKRSVRVRPRGPSKTAPLPQTNLAIKAEVQESSTRDASPGPPKKEKRRHETVPKAEKQTTATNSLRLKRSLISTHSECRTPLAPLQDIANENANRCLKRRKLDRADSFDKSKQKRSKNGGLSGAEVEEGDVIVEKENERPSTDDTGVDVSPVATSCKKAKQGGESMAQERLEDGIALEASNEVVVDVDNGVYNGSEDEEDKAAMAAAEEKRNEQIMALIEELEKARGEALQKMDDKCTSQVRNVETQLEAYQSKQRRTGKVQRMHMRKEELSTLVRDMVYKYKGDTDQILVKGFESAAQEIVQRFNGAGASEIERGNDGHANGGVRFADEAKTPRARSLRSAVAMATAEQKRLNYERCEATRNVRGTVRRSQRKAAQAATERTKRILSRYRGRTEGGMVAQEQDSDVEGTGRSEDANANGGDGSEEAFTTIQAEMCRLGALPNGAQALAVLKAKVDDAFRRLM